MWPTFRTSTDVEYREKAYAAGKIPGGFLKREAGPPTKRSRRRASSTAPSGALPEGFKNEVQVFVYVLSATRRRRRRAGRDGSLGGAVDIQGALERPIAAVRVGRVEGAWILNPTFQQLEFSDVDLTVSGPASRS